MKKILLLIALLLPLLFAEAQSLNTLSDQEKKQGWKLLFDGKTLKNWHTYGSKDIGPAWRVENGALMLYAPNRGGNKTKGGGDIVTDEIISGDFEFKIDWKVSPLANSGIFFFVTEDALYKEIYHTGLELQVLDNAIYAAAKQDNTHRAGDLFGVVSTGITEVKPVGEWNQVHVIYRKKQLKVFMNGFQMHDIDLKSAEWKNVIAKSLLKTTPIGTGSYEGRIGLQDWGSTVWYRNIKVRSL